MNNRLYIIAIILVIIWATGFFAYGAGNMVHILLAMAVIAFLLRVIKDKESIRKEQG